MKVNDKGVLFTDYQRAHPGSEVSSFTDSEGATLMINTSTLIHMYKLCKFDLERQGRWVAVMANIQSPNVEVNDLIDPDDPVRAEFEGYVLQWTGRNMEYHIRNKTTGMDFAWHCWQKSRLIKK